MGWFLVGEGGNRAVLQPLLAALYDFESLRVREELGSAFAPDAEIHLCHPFEDLAGPEALWDQAVAPLHAALPDLERRDTIVMAGSTEAGDNWVGCCGNYTGTFRGEFLGIPPTGHQAALRFHEFFRVVDGRVVEMQALWDLPELMMQAGVWPMTPSLGREWHVPGPASQDGLVFDRGSGSASLALVRRMLTNLGQSKTGGLKAMRLADSWHPKMNWYGPAGIGTCRGIEGFRHWHQIPFLNAMPDRVGGIARGHLFGDGGYVGFTAWPGMSMSLTGDGWLGIPPVGQKITMRSLDFWRCEAGLIRENWVLVDLLHVYAQLGVDVLARMREMTKAMHPDRMREEYE